MTGRTLDTSVLIPALHNRHASHQAYVRQIATADTLMQPVALEAIAEISRRPHGLAGSAQQVWPALQDTFPGPVVTLSAPEFMSACDEVTSAGVRGGAMYEALIGMCARAHKLTLVTRDRRAIATYAAVGVAYEYLETA